MILMVSKSITPEQLAKTGTEHGHQAALFCWAAQNLEQYPQLRYMFAIPNGGLRHPATAARLKAEGVKSGVPDICLPIPNRRYHGLFIELKIGDNIPSEEQYHWLGTLDSNGYYAVWANGWEIARNIIVNYLEGK